MAVYFDHAIQAPGPSSKALHHHDVEWHDSFSILAVASKNEGTDSDGCVNFYLDEVNLKIIYQQLYRTVVTSTFFTNRTLAY